MTILRIPAGELMARRTGSVNPANFPGETFELHSIPAFDRGRPEVVVGSEIGSSKQIVQENDVLISKIVPHIRRSYVVGPATGLRQIASSEWIVFRSELIYPKYFRHLLISDGFHRKFMSTVSGVGGSLLRARPAEVSKILVSVPPLDEQKRIAEVLDKADALRQKRRLALQKLDSLLQSVFLDMFGDPATNPKGWPSGDVGSVVDERGDVRCGPFGTQLKVHEITESGVPLFGIENVHNNKFKPVTNKFVTEEKARQLAAFEIEPNDVLVTRMGTIGRACVVPSDFRRGLFSYHLLRIRPNPSKCIPAFLSATICRSGTFQSQLRLLSHGAIMAGLNTSILRSVRFLLPPLNLQSEYVSIVNKTEALIRKAEAADAISDDLFESIQQRAFSGALFSPSTDVAR